MIRNPETLKAFEDDLARHEKKLVYGQAIRIVESMWHEGIALGVLPRENLMEGIEVDIRVAKVLNSCLKRSSQK